MRGNFSKLFFVPSISSNSNCRSTERKSSENQECQSFLNSEETFFWSISGMKINWFLFHFVKEISFCGSCIDRINIKALNSLYSTLTNVVSGYTICESYVCNKFLVKITSFSAKQRVSRENNDYAHNITKKSVDIKVVPM